jgi:hypothetical protein
MSDEEATTIIIASLIILIFCGLIFVAKSIYIGNWRHPFIDDSWDPSKSRGRIKK